MLEGRYAWLEEGIVDPSGEGPMIAGQPESVDESASDTEPAGDGARRADAPVAAKVQ